MDQTVGAQLRALRRSRELTQEQAAKLAGLTQGAISNIERGHVRFPGYVRRYADALGLDPTTLQ